MATGSVARQTDVEWIVVSTHRPSLALAAGGREPDDRRRRAGFQVGDQRPLLVEQPLGFVVLLLQALPLGLDQPAVLAGER